MPPAPEPVPRPTLHAVLADHSAVLADLRAELLLSAEQQDRMAQLLVHQTGILAEVQQLLITFRPMLDRLAGSKLLPGMMKR